MTNRLTSTRAHCLPTKQLSQSNLIHHSRHRSWCSASNIHFSTSSRTTFASDSANMHFFQTNWRIRRTQTGVWAAFGGNKSNLDGKSSTNMKRRKKKTWEQTIDRNHRKQVNQNADLCVSLNQPSGAFFENCSSAECQDSKIENASWGFKRQNRTRRRNMSGKFGAIASLLPRTLARHAAASSTWTSAKRKKGSPRHIPADRLQRRPSKPRLATGWPPPPTKPAALRVLSVEHNNQRYVSEVKRVESHDGMKNDFSECAYCSTHTTLQQEKKKKKDPVCKNSSGSLTVPLETGAI